MAQESRLAVTIDSRGAKRNADDLTSSLQQMERAGDAAASSAEGVSDSLEDQRRALSQLLGQINPTTAALGRLDDMQEKLAKFKKAGIVESDTFVEYTDRINTMRAALGETADGMNRAGMSAKAYQAALRGVPAQFTDIAVSLQAGQSPLTVFLQQGGQLKDMFGGVGPAARALGGYIVGLINPFTAAAAAAGVLAMAYHQGSEESERFSNALIENGNAAGLTTNQLIDMANQVTSTSGTVGAAAGVLTQLAASGNPLRTMYVEIAQASLAWSKQTGRDITDVVQTFNDIGKSPVEAIKKLDGELNILTASQYSNIQSLQEQGRTMDAAAMAAGLYAEAISSRAGEIERNLGALESAWQSITGAAKKAWDAMLDVGRDQSIEEQIANTEKLIAQRKGGIIGFFAGEDDQTLRGLETRLKQLQKALASNAAQAAQDASNKALQDAGKKGIDLINSTYKSSLTQTQKLQKQLTDLEKARKDAIASGGFTAAEEEKYAKSRKSIEQEIADIKTREAKKNAPKGVNRGVSEAETTFARLYGQYDPAAQAARTLTKEQQQLDLAFQKGKISQEEYGKALAQASTNYAAAIKGAQGLTQAEQYRAQMERQLATQRMEYAAQADAVGMGQKDATRMQERLRIEQDTNNRILQLQTELANAQGEKQRQDLQAQIDLEREYLGKRIAAQREGWAQLDQAQSSWSAGARGAFQDYLDSARDVAGQSRSFFTNAFSSMEDAVANFAISGKLSFSDFTKSILADMARIASRQAATGIFASIAGSAIGSWFGGGANGLASGSAGEVSSRLGASAAGYSPKFGFATGGYTGDGGKFEPKGVVHGGEYVVRKEVVSQPGMRDHLDRLNKKGYASGGYVSPSGSGGGQGAGVEINMPMSIVIQDRSSEGMQLDQQALQQNLQAQQSQMRAIAEDAIARSWRPGGMSFKQQTGRS